MLAAQDWLQRELSSKLNREAPNLLAHFAPPDVDGYEDLTGFISAYTTANLPAGEPLTWVFLARTIVAMIDGNHVSHRQFNGAAEQELAQLRAAAERPLPSDAVNELAAIDTVLERLQVGEEPAPELTPAQREAAEDAALIDEFKNRYSSELRARIRRDQPRGIRARFERLSAEGRL